MKNVTKILTAAVLCAALFASTQRTNALGGNAAFWPGDEANIGAFPAQVNNHSFVQFNGVGCSGDNCASEDDGSASILINKDGTAWGFNYASDDGAGDWVNMAWGNGDMGVTVGMQGGDADGDMTVGWGGSFGFGEIGAEYFAPGGDGDATLGVNWRKDCGFWIFDNAVVNTGDLMGDDLTFDANMFAHHDAGGADVMFAWGLSMLGDSMSCGDDDDELCDDAGAIAQTAAIGVEANLTDWATLRAGYNWAYELTCEGDDCDTGGSDDGFAWGLGFNWGGLTADMTVSSSLLQDPVGTITGNNHDGGGLTDTAITLTYSF